MPGKKMPPVVGKLITSGLRAAAMAEANTSPRTPLEFKVLSPRRVVNCDMGGVGLGIVAALEKSGDGFPVKQPAFAARNPVRSDPIPVNQARIVVDQETENDSDSDSGSMEEEEYTIVTCRKPGKSYTKVYRGGCVAAGERSETREPPSPPARPDGDTKIYPSPDFLSLCHLCKKKLHGKDIYMYRGENAFCSTECRWWQIGVDERREKCGSEASRSVSGSPCDHGLNFSAGIFAI